MTGRHLTEEELDRLLVGEQIGREAEQHLAGCLVCRHRESGFWGAVGAAREPEPDDEVLEQLRETALSRWSGERPGRPRWWLAVAAVLFLVILLPLSRPQPPKAALDTEALLREVDALLARDPLTAVAPEALLEAVIPSVESTDNGSVS